MLDLPPEVVERVVAELSAQGEKVVAALRTAAVLIMQAVHDESGLRLAESAAYNLREALDAVVTGRTPVPGGLPVVVEAWERFEREAAQPGNDDAASLDVFRAVIRKTTEKQERDSYHQNRLLGYLRDKSGVDPLAGDLDPVIEYQRLRRTVSQGLHRDTALDTVTGSYQDTLAWFVRMFTPPDAIVLRLRELAAQPWRGAEQVDRLRETASNPHHLRLFFARLVDPAWLDPLYEAGVVRLPESGTPWPVAGLLEGLGRSASAAVAALARRLLADCKQLPAEQRLDARFMLLTMATQLGADGHTIVGDIATAHPDVRAVRSLAAGTVKRADPTDPLVERVGTALLNAGPMDRDNYYYQLLLDRLETGMTPDNVEKRTRMVAAKVRLAAGAQNADWVALGIARLTTDLGENDRQFLIVASHYLARMMARAQVLGVASRQLLAWVTAIPGQVGERLVCRILACAEDIPLQDKIDHITRRLASPTATGDDQELVDAVLAARPGPARLAAWTDALGSPSPLPADPAVLPRDWARAWRWSAILPEHLLTGWQEPITAVAEHHGRLDREAFDRRIPAFFSQWGQSAYTEEQLAALPVLDAARLIAGWRPDADSEQRLISARELARTLQAVVAAAPSTWSTDPVAVVETLREPVYVLHYFRALTEKAADVISYAGGIIAAARLARSRRWAPTILGNDDFDFEPGWHNVDTAIIELVTALAEHDAPMADEHLDTAWSWALSALDSPPEADEDPVDVSYNRAIGTPHGRGLQTVLALADWEQRNTAAIRPRFLDTLDRVIRTTGLVAMRYRAILAWERPRLERIAPVWLDSRVQALFRDGDIGRATVDLVLAYSRYTTPWLHQTLRDEIIAAALRSAGAVPCLLLGTLHGEPGYDVDEVIAVLRKDPAVLAEAAEDMAHLVQNSSADSPVLATATRFWQALLDANRDVAPVEVLRRTGRWAFVTGLPDTIWAPLTARTLTLTEGRIDYPGEIADRCETVPVPGDSTRILLLLQGRGEPWEQHHVAQVALKTLHMLSGDRPDDNFLPLRTRLVELGHDAAADLTPYENQA
ncbi:hypothetical protein [Saccharothrix saharensis]|uniref:hypothetical protein n=1 Tax=Saccharothrix saharensis TaxID=571190 RepID=UPI00114E3407|nr:hypothetical protein [Saccharothrix saharensis]